MSKKLKITQVRSTIKRNKRQKKIIKALGLKRRGRSVTHDDSPSIRGMVDAVGHLLEVENVNGE